MMDSEDSYVDSGEMTSDIRSRPKEYNKTMTRDISNRAFRSATADRILTQSEGPISLSRKGIYTILRKSLKFDLNKNVLKTDLVGELFEGELLF